MSIEISQRPAVVSRTPVQPWDPVQYLRITSVEQAGWTPDPEAATAFASMREAARAAARLPASLRAFGLPLKSALESREDLH